MSRTTKWRRKNGIGRPTPKGAPDSYFAVAYKILKKFYPHLLQAMREDMIQECFLLEVEAQSGRIWPDRFLPKNKNKQKPVGGGKKQTMGIKSFSRACQRRFYSISNVHNFQRNGKSYKNRIVEYEFDETRRVDYASI